MLFQTVIHDIISANITSHDGTEWYHGTITRIYRRSRRKIMYSLDEVRSVDPEIAQAIVEEQTRQNSHIELIA